MSCSVTLQTNYTAQLLGYTTITWHVEILSALLFLSSALNFLELCVSCLCCDQSCGAAQGKAACKIPDRLHKLFFPKIIAYTGDQSIFSPVKGLPYQWGMRIPVLVLKISKILLLSL